MNCRYLISGAGAVAAAILGGCTAPTPVRTDYDAMLTEVMKSSFHDRGIAKVERLQQNDTNELCSQAMGKPLPDTVAKKIEAANLKTVRMPSDGRFIGDWKAGEKLAQDGRGMTWNEKSTDPGENGGNCYNCHQIGPAEISFGTIGPSLYHYGKIRGVTDPAGAAARPVVEYTWGKLFNAKAYNACSEMPRFGHAGMLDEKQLRDLMALLLDPNSPVNQ